VFHRTGTTAPGPRRRRRDAGRGRRTGSVLLLGCTLTATGCSNSVTRPHLGPGFGDVPTAHTVDAARGTLTAARLDLVSGTDSVLVTSADLGDRLFRVDTPVGTPQAPHATSSDGLVTVSLSDLPGGGVGGRQVRIVLNRGVAWTVSLDGGASQERVDLTGARLRGLVFAAGSASVTAVLPPPSGDVRVLMTGGASAYVVRAPAGVPTRVTFGGGAGSAVIDGASRSGIAGGTVVSAPGWDTAADRYTFDNSAGVSTFTLTRD
jgi:hypothetical protein